MVLGESAAAGWTGAPGLPASGGAAADSTGLAAAVVEMEVEAGAIASRENALWMEPGPVAISLLRLAGALPLNEPEILNFPKVAADSSRAPVADVQLSR